MKGLCLFLCLVLLLSLCGCGKKPAPTATTVPAGTVETQPPATETVPSTTEPVIQEPTPVVTTLTLQLSAGEEAPDGTRRIQAEGDCVTVEYWQFANSAIEFPFDGKVVYFCTDPQEMKSGSSYDLCIWEDGALKRLPEVNYSQYYTVVGQTIPLTMPYAEHAGAVYTAKATGSQYPMAFLQDGSRGVNNCLIGFETNLGIYYAVADLRTGRLTDLMANCDREVLASDIWSLREWHEDNTLVLQSSQGEFYYVNGNDGSVILYDPAAALPGVQIKGQVYLGDGFAVCGMPEGTTRATYWKFTFGEEEPAVLLENVIASSMESYLPYCLYMDEDYGRHLLDLKTGNTMQLPDGYRLYTRNFSNYVFCIDPEGAHWLADIETGQLSQPCLPEGWSVESFGEGLYQEKYLAAVKDDPERALLQVLFFNAETGENILLEINVDGASVWEGGVSAPIKMADGRYSLRLGMQTYVFIDIDLP